MIGQKSTFKKGGGGKKRVVFLRVNRFKKVEEQLGEEEKEIFVTNVTS